MSNYVKLLNNLENLELGNIKANIDQYIEMVNSNEKSVVDAFYELSDARRTICGWQHEA